MKLEKSFCKNCEMEFSLKRSDQKFCSNKCRSRFHNKANLMNSQIVKEINKITLKDYKILIDCIGNQVNVTVSRHLLKIKGFSFQRLTHFEDNIDSNTTAFGLFDLCYFKIDNDNFKILRI